ncbi:MAG: methionine adenosyltransferase [Chloroflexi bacterium]|nr:methionine adenosyltransferase [Chloroflexota bacterium]
MATGNFKHLLTSESVSDGHPDKICDQVSDGILDAALAGDPNSRVACETSCTTNRLWMFGEITTASDIDFEAVARGVIRDIGYDDPEYQFDDKSCDVNVYLHSQSPDIDAAVSTALEVRGADSEDVQQGAGDQGMMIGYAVDETPELMPLPISLAHRLTKRMSDARRDGSIPYLRPDSKSQVTIEYDDNHVPVRIDTIVLSSWHAPDVEQSQIEADLIEQVIDPLVSPDLRDANTQYLINPSGRFVTGGPHGDAGLTGRKIIVDTYGGSARHGGGAFSGKDPSKVDRSGAYAARYVAKNIVAAGLANRAEVQIAYAIGKAEPVSLMVETRGTGKIADTKIADIVAGTFDLRPSGIIETLNLRRPIYRPVAAFGHFGRPDLALPWERTDKVDALRDAAGV